MKYENTTKAKFISRPNRFIALAEIDGNETVCHVKNTGRLKELLKKNAVVYLQESSNPLRKTKYDLIAAEKDGELFNIDSQAPNIAAGEYFRKVFPDCTVRSEVKYGNSRFDFFIEGKGRKIFAEVKGVTLIKDGVALFPDAPTDRGVKHIRELIECTKEGYEAYILFVIQTEKAEVFSPNDETHRQFGDTLREAETAGVKILAVNCDVTPDEMTINKEIAINLRRKEK
ncbi:MAG: DNA/RNA nuclease SfsA [Clostridia bacterium]|nr:DNA/RNA nuclease SfsA [Clostridia bacterium]